MKLIRPKTRKNIFKTKLLLYIKMKNNKLIVLEKKIGIVVRKLVKYK